MFNPFVYWRVLRFLILKPVSFTHHHPEKGYNGGLFFQIKGGKRIKIKYVREKTHFSRTYVVKQDICFPEFSHGLVIVLDDFR